MRSAKIIAQERRVRSTGGVEGNGRVAGARVLPRWDLVNGPGLTAVKADLGIGDNRLGERDGIDLIVIGAADQVIRVRRIDGQRRFISDRVNGVRVDVETR